MSGKAAKQERSGLLRARAIEALQLAGWSPEDIACVLQRSRATVERALGRSTTEPPASRIPPGRCCEHVAGGGYCDRPVAVAGGVFCAMHTRPGAWLA